MAISRRRLLLGGAALVAGGGGAAYGLVERGVVPGRSALDRALGRCDVDAPWPRGAPRADRTDGTFASAARRTEVAYTVVRPAGVTGPLPLVLVLHGRGSSAGEYVDGLHLDAFLAAHVAAGGRPFALACADGGDRYWHPRADGDDPLRMLTDELLPLLRERGLTTDPMGALGWSMGGYGALLLARQARAGRLPRGVRLAAAVAESPALFRTYAASTRGAFDSAADFAEWGDLVRTPGVDPAEVALRVDCGERDPFEATARAYRAAVRPAPAGGFTPGCHTSGYWRGRAAAQLAFLGAHLT